MDRTRRLLTSEALGSYAAPHNTFLHVTKLMSPSSRQVVKPNNDTLYSSAWLDLRKGPLVLSVPDTAGRYYSLMFMDAYTNGWAYVGRRTTGTKAGRFVIVGPDRSGGLPDLPVLRSPTDTAWLLGRTLVEGPHDLAAATELIARYRLTTVEGADPEVAYFTGPTPSPQHTGTAGITFFDELCRVIAHNPLGPEEQAYAQRFAELGIGPGHIPSVEVTDSRVRAALETAGTMGDATLKLAVDSHEGHRAINPVVDGWAYNLLTGSYGQEYLLRARVAFQGVGALHPEEALYVTAQADAEGRPLDARRRYRLRFPAGALPPVAAFWSLTAYDQDQYLIRNPIRRYSVGDRTPGLVYGADGSLELQIQRDEPVEGVSNWLPIDGEAFELVLRCYQPADELLDGSYTVPALIAVHDDDKERSPWLC
jgi:hypothetical protein